MATYNIGDQHCAAAGRLQQHLDEGRGLQEQQGRHGEGREAKHLYIYIYIYIHTHIV